MTRLTKTVCSALALALFSVSPAASPVYAKDKAADKPASADVIGDKIRPFLAAAQEASGKKDFAGVLVQVDKAAPLATTPYEKFLVGQFRAIAAQNVKDNANMVRGLDEAVDSGYSSPSIATFALISGQTAYTEGNYAKAIDRFTKAQAAGSTEPSLPIFIADSYFKSNRTAEGLAIAEKSYQANKAANRLTPEDEIARAAQASLNAKSAKDELVWLTRLVESYPTPTNWHDLLVIYRDAHPLSAQGILDLYRLMKVTKSFKSPSEVEEYAITALDKRGLPGEAKAAMEDAMTAGIITKLSPSMAEIKNVATAKSGPDRSSLPASEKQAASAANGKIAKGTADAYFGYKEYTKASEMYKLAQTKGGVEPRLTSMGLGESYALGGAKDDAIAAFGGVTGEAADLANFWVMWLKLAK
jgi:tetratricopeptide (TPR) repeat protein